MGELTADGAGRLSFALSRDDHGVPLVTLRGDLDMASADQLDAAVEPIVAESPDRLVVDVSGLRFADSSAIALWVRWANAVHQIEIREPSPLLRRVIESMGLAQKLRLNP
jgi:anti-sigma B factor antagonist